jgi:hypothetical protein
VDIAVLDYGLSAGQRRSLDSAGVFRVECEKNGHPANLRFRDLDSFLGTHAYGNVLITDGGDVIFQQDVTPLLRQNMKHIHACREPSPSFAVKYWAGGSHAQDRMKKVRARFLAEPMINCGVLVGPSSAFRDLCGHLSEDLARHMDFFGAEQPLISEYLLEKGYTPLDCRYNFMPMHFPFGVRVSKGRVFDPAGLVPIVHNCGGLKIARPLGRFGFARWHNFKKPIVFQIAKMYRRKYAQV